MGKVRCLLDVVAGSGCGLAVNDVLSHITAHAYHDAVHEISLFQGVLILLGKAYRKTQCPSVGYDRNLVEGVGILKIVVQQRVTCLMVCSGLLFICSHETAFTGNTENDLIPGLLVIGHGDGLPFVAGGKERRFIDQVGQVGTGGAGGCLCNPLKIDVITAFNLLRMDAENVKSFLDVRKIDDDLPVEASRTKQCRIENIRAVGRSYYDDAGVGGEAVHLNENLVESLLPFIVTAAKSASSGAAHRIKLINEENTGSVLPSGLE